MPCNRATARNDREKIAQYIGELVQKTVISSILCRKTSSENHRNQCDHFHNYEIEIHQMLETRHIMVKTYFLNWVSRPEKEIAPNCILARSEASSFFETRPT